MTLPDYDTLALYIDGEWRSGQGRESEPVLDPATGSVLAELPHAKTADLEDALTAAERSFKSWRHVSAYDRSGVLRRAANLLRERLDHHASVLVMEEGKTLGEARGEISISADIFDWCAEEGRRAYGRIVPARNRGEYQLVNKVPLGPVAAFAPWNFPAITPARKIAASLAAGCTCILKPSEETPATALALARALHDAELPAGVLNIVFGIPGAVSEHLLTSPIIRKLSFTGSTVVGRELAKLAADRVIKSTLELGGHAPVLVFDDADIDLAVSQAVIWKSRNAGQVCTSPTRFYVQEGIFRRFVDQFSAAMEALRVGNGLDPDMNMGPLANERRLTALETLIDDAQRSGASLNVPGGRVKGSGYIYRPTVLSNIPEDARIMQEEPFGAVALINSFSTLDDAIALANRLPYGLAAYAFTSSLRTATAVSQEVDAGMIGVNTFSVAIPETPFGGTKNSGYGSEGGSEGLDGYLETRFVHQC